MTELNELKDALREPPDFAARPLDLDAVMSTGGRIRRRRRLTIGATSGLAVLALLVGVNAVAQRGGTDGNGTPPAAVQPTAVEPTVVPPAEADTVIRTGLKEGGAEWVLFAKPVSLPDNPQITFGIMLGRSISGGDPEDAVMSNEVEGSDSSPGFHAVQAGMDVEAGSAPTFGYYAGPATRITAKVGGKTVTADQAALTDGIQVFWIDGGGVRDLTAYDAAGELLPAGNNTPGVG